MPSVKIPNGSGGWIKIPTVKGDAGTITSVTLTSGNHAAGTTDTYTITYNDNSTTTFTVYNGADGNGAGDMLKTTYDTNNSGVVDNAEKVNGLTVLTAVPIGAVFTDTIYTHPANHSPSIITQDASNRFVTDTEKSTWSGKQDALGFTPATSTHTHGNITNDGKIGSTADLPVFTTTAGAVATKSIADAKTLLGITAGGAQIATGSYTGAGTFGSGSPNSLTFGFAPKIVWIYASLNISGGSYSVHFSGSPIANMDILTTNYVVERPPSLSSGSSAYAKKSADEKTLYWYNSASAAAQLNSSGFTFYYFAIG